MIPCTEFCVYQREGICELTSAGAGGTKRADGCSYLVEPGQRTSKEAGTDKR